jgi:hypothetical protein
LSIDVLVKMVKEQIIKSFVGSWGMLHVFQKSPWPPEAFLQEPQLTIVNGKLLIELHH